MKKRYEILDWDSRLFGFKVCRIPDTIVSNDELNETLKLLGKHQVNLAYYSRKNILESLDVISDVYDFKLVDKKTTYLKKLGSVTESYSSISEYKEEYPEKKLIELAIESGVYSRFNIDRKIPKEKFQELYSLWIINSVNKKIAREVLVYRVGNEIAGFVTLGVKNGRADIGIIAVDSHHRGKGIGKSLIFSAENWFITNRYNPLQIVTQADNKPACRLFESCGYGIESVEYFYHLWKK